jgi:putative transposase
MWSSIRPPFRAGTGPGWSCRGFWSVSAGCRCIFIDGGYAGELAAWASNLLPGRGLRLKLVKRSDANKHRFAILPKRWIVERTFGWLSKFRRLSKDYEFPTENSEAIILIAATRLMLARLA